MFNCGSLKAIIISTGKPPVVDSKIIQLHKCEVATPGCAAFTLEVGGTQIGLQLLFGFKEQAACAGCSVLIIPEEGEATLCNVCKKKLSAQPQSFDEGGELGKEEGKYKTQ